MTCLVEAVRHKEESLRVDSFRPHYSPGIETASNRDEEEGYLREVKVAGL